jgi:Putative bacterial sensory transduction regulator
VSSKSGQGVFENLLQVISDSPMGRDPDGDYVISYAGAKFYARILGEVHPVVQIFSVVASNLPAIGELYAYLNHVNSLVHHVRVFHVQDQVLVEAELTIEDLSPASFHKVCRHVAETSDSMGQDLVREFGGNPRWQHGKKANYAFGFSPA